MSREIAEYIVEASTKGLSDVEIRDHLVNAGRPLDEVERAISQFHESDFPEQGILRDDLTSNGSVKSQHQLRPRQALIVVMILVLACGSAYAALRGHSKIPTSIPDATFLASSTPSHRSFPSPTPPASVKAPYPYNDKSVMLTGWIPRGATSCILTDLYVLVSPVQDAFLDDEQALIGGNSTTPAYPKVQSDGSFSVLVDKGQNVRIFLSENPLAIDSGSTRVCLTGIYLASSKDPVVVDAKSTALNVMLPSLDISSVNSATIDKILDRKSFQTFVTYLEKTLPNAPLSTVADPSGPNYSMYFDLEQNYFNEVSAGTH